MKASVGTRIAGSLLSGAALAKGGEGGECAPLSEIEGNGPEAAPEAGADVEGAVAERFPGI